MVKTKVEKEIRLNKDAIAINQDPTEQGKKFKSMDNVDIWVKQLKDGEKAVLVVNRNTDDRIDISLKLSDFGIDSKLKIIEVYSQKVTENSKWNVKFDLESHACPFLLIR
jgi:alpha-galactosidase